MAVSFCHDCCKNIDLDYEDEGMQDILGTPFEVCWGCWCRREDEFDRDQDLHFNSCIDEEEAAEADYRRDRSIDDKLTGDDTEAGC